MAEKIISTPEITISNITSHSFVINASVPSGNAYETPLHFLLSIYCNTPGASFQTIQELTVNNFPYTVTGLWGGESFFILVEAVYEINYEEIITAANITVNTPLIPITSISYASGSDTVTLRTGGAGSGQFAYNNLIIRPNVDYGDADNASVLDGDRLKAKYIVEGTGKIYIARTDLSGQGNLGWVQAIDGGRGICNIKIIPGDEVNVDTAYLLGTVVIEQAVKSIEVSPNYISGLLSDGNITLENIRVLPDDANNKDVTFTSDDTSVCTVSGNVLTPVSAGICTVTATSDESANIYNSMIVEIKSGSYMWHDNYDTCPEFMNTTDFNAIVDNALYLANKFSVTLVPAHTPQKALSNDSFLTAKYKINRLILAIGDILFAASVSTSGIVIIRNSKYAPTQSQWNYILDKMRVAKNK